MTCEASTVEQTQGDDWLLNCTARKKSNGEPFPITGATEISVAFKKTDGTTLTKNLAAGVAITNGPLGKFSITVPKLESAVVKAGLVKFFPVVTIAGKDTTVRGMELSVLTRS